MKKYAILTSVLTLAACGGASAPQLSVHDSNFMITSNIDNDARRHVHIMNTLGTNYASEFGPSNAAARSAASDWFHSACETTSDCDDLAFYNMKTYLLDNDFTNWENINSLRDALILAGFKNEIPDDSDELTQWARDNKSQIQDQAQKIYNEFGQHYDFDVSASDISIVEDSEHPTKLRFVLDDETGEITKITMIDRMGMPDEMTWDGRRHGQSTRFSVHSPVFEYKINGVGSVGAVDYDGPGYQSFRFMANHDMTLDEIKAMFVTLATAELAKGDDGYFGSFHAGNATPQIVYDDFMAQLNTITSKDQLEILQRHEEHNYNISAYGKEVGLAYSDFGYLEPLDPGEYHEQEVPLYHGGYHDHKTSDETLAQLGTMPDENLHFTGRAIGRVNYNTNINFSNGYRVTNKEVKINGTSALDFNNGVSTLTMLFPDWYDVHVTNDSDNNTITFNNFTGTDTDLMFRIRREMVNNADGDQVRENYTVEHFDNPRTFDSNGDGMTGFASGSVDIQYFGNDTTSIPSEASGSVTYYETEPHWDDGLVKQIQFESAFGATRDYNNE